MSQVSLEEKPSAELCQNIEKKIGLFGDEEQNPNELIIDPVIKKKKKEGSSLLEKFSFFKKSMPTAKYVNKRSSIFQKLTITNFSNILLLFLY